MIRAISICILILVTLSAGGCFQTVIDNNALSVIYPNDTTLKNCRNVSDCDGSGGT